MNECKGSPFLIDADLFTVGSELASAAKRGDRLADELPKRNKEIIVNDPVFFGEFLPKRPFALFGGFRLDIADPVRNAMDMGVDADSRLPIRDGHHQVGGLSSDARQGEKLLDRVRHPAVKLFQ